MYVKDILLYNINFMQLIWTTLIFIAKHVIKGGIIISLWYYSCSQQHIDSHWCQFIEETSSGDLCSARRTSANVLLVQSRERESAFLAFSTGSIVGETWLYSVCVYVNLPRIIHQGYSVVLLLFSLQVLRLRLFPLLSTRTIPSSSRYLYY